MTRQKEKEGKRKTSSDVAEKEKRQGLSDVRGGEFANIFRHLNGLGLSREQYLTLGDKDEALRQSVAGTVRWMTLFSSPEEQIRRMFELNDKVWHDPEINREEIERIGPPPLCPAPYFTEDEARFYCLFLFYEFGYEKNGGTRADPLKTFWRYWDAMKHVFGEENLAFGDDYYNEKKGEIVRSKKPYSLSFVEGSMDMHQVGFSWRLVEFYRFIECHDAGEGRKKVFEISSDLCPRGLGHEILGIPIMHPNWMRETDLSEQIRARLERDLKARTGKEEKYWIGFGLQPPLALELNIISEDGRSYIPQLRMSDDIIYFQAAAGPGARCPVYYKKLIPRYSHSDSMLPKGD